MSCTTCKTAKPLLCCLDSIIIGTITSASQSLLLYLKKISTGRIECITVESDVSGLVTADVSELKDILQPGSQFELWVTKNDAESSYDRETVTDSNEEEFDCALLTFEQAHGSEITTQTIFII